MEVIAGSVGGPTVEEKTPSSDVGNVEIPISLVVLLIATTTTSPLSGISRVVDVPPVIVSLFDVTVEVEDTGAKSA